MFMLGNSTAAVKGEDLSFDWKDQDIAVKDAKWLMTAL